MENTENILLMFLGSTPEGTNILKHWCTLNDGESINSKVFVICHPYELSNFIINIKFKNLFISNNIIVVDEDHHLKTQWGTHSLSSATLLMMQYSHIHFKQQFKKYVLLSGLCCPLYSINNIYNKLNNDIFNNKSWFLFYDSILDNYFIKSYDNDIIIKSEIKNIDTSQWMIIDYRHMKFFFVTNYGSFKKSMNTIEQYTDRFIKKTSNENYECIILNNETDSMFKNYVEVDCKKGTDECFFSTWILFKLFNNLMILSNNYYKNILIRKMHLLYTNLFKVIDYTRETQHTLILKTENYTEKPDYLKYNENIFKNCVTKEDLFEFISLLQNNFVFFNIKDRLMKILKLNFIIKLNELNNDNMKTINYLEQINTVFNTGKQNILINKINKIKLFTINPINININNFISIMKLYWTNVNLNTNEEKYDFLIIFNFIINKFNSFIYKYENILNISNINSFLKQELLNILDDEKYKQLYSILKISININTFFIDLIDEVYLMSNELNENYTYPMTYINDITVTFSINPETILRTINNSLIQIFNKYKNTNLYNDDDDDDNNIYTKVLDDIKSQIDNIKKDNILPLISHPVEYKTFPLKDIIISFIISKILYELNDSILKTKYAIILQSHLFNIISNNFNLSELLQLPCIESLQKIKAYIIKNKNPEILNKIYGTPITSNDIINAITHDCLFIRKCYDSSLIETYSSLLKSINYDKTVEPINDISYEYVKIDDYNSYKYKYLKYKKKYINMNL